MAETLETLLVLLKGDDAQLKRTLKGIERETADTKKKVSKNLDFGTIGANLGGLAGGGGILFALRSFAGESAKAKGEAQSFFNTLERAGISQTGITADLQTTADSVGLLTTQLQGAATPLLKLGVDAETTNAVLLGLASSAGIAGKSGAELANAVAQSAVGIAQGRSELLETSSVLVNASQAQKTFAGSIGVSVSALSDEQKALAYARAVIAETEPDVADFADTYGEYAKSQSAAAKASDEFRKSVGAIAQEGLIPLNNALGGVLGFVNDLPDPVQRSGVAFVAAGAGALTLAGGIGTLALVLGPLLGPAGLFVLAAAGVAAFVTASTTAPPAARDLETALQNLKTANEDLDGAIKSGTTAQREQSRAQLEAAVTATQAALKLGEAELTAARSRQSAGLQLAGGDPTNENFQATLENSPSVARVREGVEALRTGLKGAQEDLRNFNRDAAANFTGLPLLFPDGPPTPPPGGSGKTDRTVADVFGDLAKEGTVAEQRAAALGTLEAQVESLETRARAADGALEEVLNLGGTPEQVDYLAGRVKSLNEQLEALGEKDISVQGAVERDIPLLTSTAGSADVVAADRQIINPKVSVEFTGDPVDIFGVVFDPLTGTTSVGAVPTVRLRALVDIEIPNASASVKDAVDLLTSDNYSGPSPYAKTSGPVPLLTSDDYRGDMPTVDVDQAGKRITEAGDIFKSGVLEAGQGFANALADGKISGKEGGGILGGLLGAGLGAGGIALGIPPQLSLALGGIIGDLTGGLLGGLFGGDDEKDSRSRAAKDLERRGGASAVTFNLFASQTNSFSGNIVEPQVQNALDRQVDQLVKSALERVNFDRVAKKATA